MGDFYIRVSAQNLSQTVYDTNDLSTIRGGSFALLKAIDAAVATLPNPTIIFKGASELFCEVKCDKIEDIIEKVKIALQGDYQYSVSSCEKTDMAANLKTLDGKNRIAQYQNLSFVMPSGKVKNLCSYDNMRPATHKLHGTKEVSRFVKTRHIQGRRLRAKQYFTTTCGVSETWYDTNKPYENLTFSKSLQDLLWESKSLSPAIAGKIALIHIDGNGFQSKRNELSKDAAKLSQFSQDIQKKHTEIVTAMLEYCFNNDGKMIKDQTSIRLETLMWGGDELVFAVPAFAAFDLVEVIQNCLKGFQYKYATGVVFAPVKTPIRAMKKIAEELVDEAKHDKTVNAVSFFACESVDLPVGGLSAARAKLFDAQDANYALTDFATAKDWLKNVSEKIPKSQAMKLARELKNHSNKDDWFAHLEEEFKRLYGDNSDELTKLLKEQPFLKDAPLHLPLLTALHLWDYANV